MVMNYVSKAEYMTFLDNGLQRINKGLNDQNKYKCLEYPSE